MNFENKFQERFIKVVRERGLKQIEISDRTGIPRGQINEYLKGKCKPKQDKLHMIAKALNVSPIWLMGYDVPMNDIDNIVKTTRDNINDILNNLNENQLEQAYQMLKIMFNKEV